jgi:hypothetical protein
MKSKILFSAMFLAFLGLANFSVAQDGSFTRNHPRRAEVNHRLNKQDQRIHDRVRNGDISRREAHRLYHKNHRIRNEEGRMAYRHGGHLSRHDYKRLNRQENRLNRRIIRS